MSLGISKVVFGQIGSIDEERDDGSRYNNLKSFDRQDGSTGYVIEFTIASNDSRYNKKTQEYDKVGTLWTTVVAWDALAKNINDSFQKGDSVIVVGEEEMRPGFTNRNGEEMPARPILRATRAGHDLLRGTSEFERSAKKSKDAGGSKKKSKKPDKDPLDDYDSDEEEEEAPKPKKKSQGRKSQTKKKPSVDEDEDLFADEEDEEEEAPKPKKKSRKKEEEDIDPLDDDDPFGDDDDELPF